MPTLRMLPKTLKQFESQYGTSKLEYKKYLRQNAHQHHYVPYSTMAEWYEAQSATRN